MIWICSVVYLVVAVLGRLSTQRWLNLLTVFAGFYGITISLAAFQFFGMNAATVKECVVFLIGIIFFTFGFLCSRSLRLKRQSIIISDSNFCIDCRMRNTALNRYFLRRWLLILVLIFVFSYTLYRVYLTLDLLGKGFSYAQIRAIYFNADEIAVSLSKYGRSTLGNYIHHPLLIFLIITASMALFKNDVLNYKYRRVFIILVYVTTGLYSFSNGGREIVFYSLLVIVFCFIILGKKPKNNLMKPVITKTRWMTKVFIALVFLVSVVLMYRLSVGRNHVGKGSVSDLLRTIYIYFCGYVPHLGIRLEELSWDDFTYGNTFILGIIKPFAAVIRELFGVTFSSAYVRADTITSLLQSRVDIGGGMSMNAFVSLFYYFFIDCGYFGVAVGSCLYGVFCGVAEKMFYVRRDQLSIFMYCYAFFTIMASMVRWPLVHPSTAMILLFMLVLFRRNKKHLSFGLNQSK